MYLVLYRFSKNGSKAAEFISAHNVWVDRGFDDGSFVFAGGLLPQIGGVIVAQASSARSWSAGFGRIRSSCTTS